jgi:hypothetical protein
VNGPELAAAVKARLESLIPSRTVYTGAVPDGTLPARYLVVYASEGTEDATRMTGTVSVQTPSLWVSSVSRNASPKVAADEAAWGSGKVRAALRNWRPESAWSVRSETSQPARRDESIATTTFYAVEQFSLRSHI